MNNRTYYQTMLLPILFFGVLNIGIITSAYADQDKVIEQQQAVPNVIYGKVTETMDAVGYTYVEVDAGGGKVWAAGPVTPLKVGDMVAFSTGMVMENFYSKAMKRDFPVIYFVNSFTVDEESVVAKAAATASPHDQIQHQVGKSFKGVNKVEGGKSIAEIHAQKNNLKGKIVRVRGQVTRFTAAVMNRNWIHVRDSSTDDDLTVTTDASVAIDDVVIIEGRLELERDFGYGYVYPVIVEQARVTKE
jgi:hypothetical protein